MKDVDVALEGTAVGLRNVSGGIGTAEHRFWPGAECCAAWLQPCFLA